MANDWRSRIDERIDEFHRRQREEEERKRKAEEERIDRQMKKRQEELLAEIRREDQRDLARHQRRFRCHVCGKPSKGPHVSRSIEWHGDSGGGETWYRNWDTPTGLKKCDRCSKWTCEEHIYRGICSRCASKL